MLYYTESNRKLPHQFIHINTANLIPEFAVEVLPLGRTAVLVPEFTVKHPDDDCTYKNIKLSVVLYSMVGKLCLLP